MPTSRRRRRPKRRERRERHAPRSPYASIVRGVLADPALRDWYDRACWSFHRAPFPVYDDREAQELAVGRAAEWFVFDLVLPDRGCTPAESWIAAESARQRWSAAVTERYLRFTRGEFGVFHITAMPPPMLVLEERPTGRIVHALLMDAFVDAKPGDLMAARLFPLEDASVTAQHPEVRELSPGSDVLRLSKKAARDLDPGLDALAVEALFGAGGSWLAEAAGTGAVARFVDPFLRQISQDGLTTDDLRVELRELPDPEVVIRALAAEVAPLTREEPLLVAAMISTLWLHERQRAGTSERTLKKLARAWERRLENPAGAPEIDSTRLPLPDVDEARWRLSEHEIARLRALPLVAEEWIGRRRMVRIPIQEAGQLPEYPDAGLWVQPVSGKIAGVSIVPSHAPQHAMLATLTDAMSNTGSRPARVVVQGATLAAGLRRALSPLGTIVEARYVEPALAPVFDRLEEFGAEQPEQAFEGAQAPSRGYLGLPGSSAEQLERFMGATSAFYQAAPWRLLADDRAIDIELPAARAAQGGYPDRVVAVLMGHGGKTFGLALYFDVAEYEMVIMGAEPAESFHFDTLAVTFNDEDSTDPVVLNEIREHRWPVAGRRAFPTAMRTSPHAPPRLIAGAELDLAAATLDAVRGFVSRLPPGGPPSDVRREETIAPGFGSLVLTLEP